MKFCSNRYLNLKQHQAVAISVHEPPLPGRPRNRQSNENRHQRNPTSRIFLLLRPRARHVNRLLRPTLRYTNFISSIRKLDDPTRFHLTTMLSPLACNSCSIITCSPRYSPQRSHSQHFGRKFKLIHSYNSRTHSSCNLDSRARRMRTSWWHPPNVSMILQIFATPPFVRCKCSVSLRPLRSSTALSSSATLPRARFLAQSY